MSEVDLAPGAGTTLPGAVCAVLVLGCVLRQRGGGGGAAWPCCLLALLQCCRPLPGCQGRGRLVDPPSRASMWRFGFVNPVDFNDDRVDCGGFARQWRKNRGRCGVCGDPWDEPAPRPHETRGRYARGTLVRTYTQAQAVVVAAEVTAAGAGHFEYRLCPRETVWEPETQECFTHLLQDDQGRSQIPVSVSHKFARLRHVLRLPQDLSCPACVLQWKYVTTNQAGRAEYRACADVTITPAQDTASNDTTTATATAPAATTPATESPAATTPAAESPAATTLTPAGENLVAPEPAHRPHAADTLSDGGGEVQYGRAGAQARPHEMQNDAGYSGGGGSVGGAGGAGDRGEGAAGKGGAAPLTAPLGGLGVGVAALLCGMLGRGHPPGTTAVLAALITGLYVQHVLL